MAFWLKLKQRLMLRLKMLTDVRYRQFYRQRLVMDIVRRSVQADRVASLLPQGEKIDDPDLAKRAIELRDQGFTNIDALITPQQIVDMRGYFEHQKCFDPERLHLGVFSAPNEVPAETHVAFFDNEQVIRAPHALAIANDPRVIAITGAILNAKPTVSVMTAWWSTPTPEGTPEQAERFHRDVDDWRFIKLFVYLTDVDNSAGPHMFAAGSHKINALMKIGRYADEEVENAIGKQNIVRFCGRAGTAFLENTFGLHKGLPPQSTPRLVFQVLYSLRPVIYGPSIPIVTAPDAAEGHAIDPYINRVYCHFT